MYKEKTIVLFTALKHKKFTLSIHCTLQINVSKNAYKSMGFFFLANIEKALKLI